VGIHLENKRLQKKEGKGSRETRGHEGICGYEKATELPRQMERVKKELFAGVKKES